MASLLERVLFHQGTKLKFTTDNRTIHFECASENYMPIPSAGVEAAYRSKTFFMIAFGFKSIDCVRCHLPEQMDFHIDRYES